MHLFGLVISPFQKRLVAGLDNIPPEPRFTPSCQRAVFVWISNVLRFDNTTSKTGYFSGIIEPHNKKG